MRCRELSRSGYFNPRSPCGERLAAAIINNAQVQFQSTLPVWGATPSRSMRQRWRLISIHAPRVGSDAAAIGEVAVIAISIHAPRVGSDDLRGLRRTLHANFNPRSPCGERPSTSGKTLVTVPFQSTLPVWGATPFR